MDGIAIIGMAARLPGAANVAQFWQNQLAGVESISNFSPAELNGFSEPGPATKYRFSGARSILDGVDLFDAEFFGIHPREAQTMDPQQRIFMECCWEALEAASYNPYAYSGEIGLYAGCSLPTYLLAQLCREPGFIDRFTSDYQTGSFSELIGNGLDFLSTRISYKLNLRGPSMTLLSACSTSLLSVSQACQALMNYQCDMALAGGVSISFPQKRAAQYVEGGIASPDGHVRTFDASAQGTVFGDGAAVVLLKRLDEALAAGDYIHAVVRGYGVNNDGSNKVGYTAPSIDGQARVIAHALEMAGVRADTIGYVEAHGTGTPLGDPIELAALSKVFRAETSKSQYCVIGTAKTNVGHLDAAAGITGLINATHIVREGIFPPTLHYRQPNPKFDLANSPFRVAVQTAKWDQPDGPRRAGVSAFGIGGTNVHLIVEQHLAASKPANKASVSASPHQLLVLSARTAPALDRMSSNLANQLTTQPETELASAAWTLQSGRRAFKYRRCVVAQTSAEAAMSLRQHPETSRFSALAADSAPKVHFMFPGQGAQRAGMGRELYAAEPAFGAAIDLCAKTLTPILGIDIRKLLTSEAGDNHTITQQFTDTSIVQPTLFAFEYALAQLWLSWGIRPSAVLGHSIGEFVAACIAGVFSLEDALRLVATRGRLMRNLPSGAMISVALPEAAVLPYLAATGSNQVSIAALNGPRSTVFAGPSDVVEQITSKLNTDGIAFRHLAATHAFHSPMMDAVIAPFRSSFENCQLSAPTTPVISSVTGTWLTPSEATSPDYWARHLREPVRFADAVALAQTGPDATMLEVGPGGTLSAFARQNAAKQDTGQSRHPVVITTLPYAESGSCELAAVREALGALWCIGAEPDWSALHTNAQLQKIPLPTYPFERQSYWYTPSVVKQSSDADPQKPAANHQNGERAPNSQIASTQVEAQDPNKARPMINQSPSNETPHDAGGRQIVTAKIIQIFTELSGTDLSKSNQQTNFIEMGFDSLFLAQVSRSLQKTFEVTVPFRKLLREASTFDALTDLIHGELPATNHRVIAATKNKQSTIQAPQDRAVQADAPQTAALDDVASEKAPLTSTEQALPANSVGYIVAQQLETMKQIFATQLEAARGQLGRPTTAAPISSQAASVKTAHSPQIEQPVTPPLLPSATVFKPFGPFKPIQLGTSGALSPLQHASLTSLIDQYSARTAQSKALAQRYRQSLADPRAVSGFKEIWKEMTYPIAVNRSLGSQLWDVDGNSYIDLLNGFGPTMFGHQPDFVVKALEQQLQHGIEIGPQTPLAGEVAELFCELTGNERMTFCNTGSEAVMAALRVARTVTGRDKVAIFAGAYHGMFDEVLVKPANTGGSCAMPGATPIAAGIPRESIANMIVLDYAKSETLAWLKEHAAELAAVLVEPVQSRRPGLQPVEFLKEVREITASCGTALIFDEIVTGFRVHPGGCQELFGIRADLATYGKVLGGGMPVGVLAGRAAFMDALDGGQWQYGDSSCPEVGVTFFAGTFVRHPLALAAIKAVLQKLKFEGPALQEHLKNRTAALVARINTAFNRHGIPTHADHFGSIVYFAMPPHERYASLFYYVMRLNGVHIMEGFPCFLTTAHSDADIDKVVAAFETSSKWMQQSGFLLEQPATISNEGIPALPPARNEPPTPRLEVKPGKSHHVAPENAPLTEGQREVFLAAMVSDEASCAFNEGISIDLRGPLEHDALRTAIDTVGAHHDALRAVVSTSGADLQFKPKVRFDTPLIDISELGDAEANKRLAEMLKTDGKTPFDLTHGPLARFLLVRLAPNHHRLIMTAHHIICDGWSINIILDDVAKAYTKIVQGVAAALEPALQFSDYAASQAQQVAASDNQIAENYWLDQFKQLPSPLELPADRIRQNTRTYTGATCRAHIDQDLYAAIKKAGSKKGASLFVTLLTGFTTLLQRLTQTSDVVVAVPFAGQSQMENGRLVGHCVNFLPIRVKLDADETFATRLSRVGNHVLDAHDHQNYTYGTLVHRLKIQRDPSRLPLTQVQFNLEQATTLVHFKDLQSKVESNNKAAVNFDIFLNVVEHENGLDLECDYATDLFDRATVERWLGHYKTLLQDATHNVDRNAMQLQLLSDTDQQRLRTWNNTTTHLPADVCTHTLIEQQCRDNPGSIAAICGDRSVTYADLDARANQLANHLLSLGAKSGVCVAVFVERSLDMLIALLGIMKTGATYVPLDPTHPKERVDFMLKDSKATIVLTQSALAETCNSGTAHVVALDRAAPMIDAASTTAPPISVSQSDLAYVIYTSGSTGRPKGVMITHRSVVNLLLAMQSRPGMSRVDIFAAVTTLSFDIAALELFLPLSVGAKLVIANREQQLNGHLLLDVIKRHRVTVMQATPVTWRLLMEAGWDAATPLKVLCGGEALPRDLADQLLQRADSVWNMYGPTETTIWSAVDQVVAENTLVLIGPPIANTQFYVLDNNLAPAPIGVPGELHIAGEGLARGYHDRPDLTREKFIPNPFTNDSKSQMYKTGDLVRSHADGRLEFLGRLDHQVKLRGFRIELGEIEAALLQHPDIKEAAVTLSPDAHGDQRLVAYLVAKRTAMPSIADVRTHLEPRLPAYMVPAVLVQLPAMPVTLNGKVDRKALIATQQIQLKPTANFVPAETKEQETLAQICSEVLGVPRVSAGDNLFELGMDSLGVFRIASRAQKAGLNLTIKDILQKRTVRAIMSAETPNTGSLKNIMPKITPVSRDRYKVAASTSKPNGVQR